MFTLILVLLLVAVFILGICAFAIYLLRGSKKRLKDYASRLHETIAFQQAQINQLTEEKDKVVWERDAAHMMLENVVQMVPAPSEKVQNGSTSELVEKDS